MTLKGISLIGFDLGSTGGAEFQAFDPVKNVAVEPKFVSATLAEVDCAMHLAAAAAPKWARVSGAERGIFLRLIAAKLESSVAPLTERAVLETALPRARCESEIARTAGQLRLYAETAERGDWLDIRIETAQPDRKPLPKPDHRSMLRPLGPVAVFGSSNFPFAFSVAGGDTASAFAAGCPVIVKAHPAHPGTSELVGRLIVEAVRECGLAEGSFSLLFDSGFEIGQALVKHALVTAVGFTGSLRGGRHLADLAAARPEPIPVYAEMGSINPVFILPGALAERAAAICDGLYASANAGVGQFCTSPGLIVMQRSRAAEEFLQALVGKLSATPECVMLSPTIRKNFESSIAARAAHAGVNRITSAPAPLTGGVAPVWFETKAAIFVRERSMSAEIFGPSSLVVWCENRAEMLEVARHLEGSLSATIQTGVQEASGQGELTELLAVKAGRVIQNGFPTGLEVSQAMVHGGPYPASSDGGRSTSVGTRALSRWARPVCYQNFSDKLLPAELQTTNPVRLRRMINGEWLSASA